MTIINHRVGTISSDVLIGILGKNLLIGGDGNDELYGNSDDDILYGGTDNDIISGFDGNDKLYGADGDDELNGDSGDKLAFDLENSMMNDIINTLCLSKRNDYDYMIGDANGNVVVISNNYGFIRVFNDITKARIHAENIYKEKKKKTSTSCQNNITKLTQILEEYSGLQSLVY